MHFDDQDDAPLPQLTVPNPPAVTFDTPQSPNASSSPSSNAELSDLVSSTRPQRTKSRPAWMQDYEVPGIDHVDDPLTHFALFSDCDPVAFNDAVQDPKWQKAMNEEIHAIEKNNTWELTDLPKGHKSIGVK